MISLILHSIMNKFNNIAIYSTLIFVRIFIIFFFFFLIIRPPPNSPLSPPPPLSRPRPPGVTNPAPPPPPAARPGRAGGLAETQHRLFGTQREARDGGFDVRLLRLFSWFHFNDPHR